ncbi:FidL-like protein [Edaphovirga cremea]|uniref:FidL-like protein n=1 Tax=Edaphovirga cremea TaxID=2267246 RepID=UPI000DEF996C|nr:FidL-like protein [Edaphovirga cremea]
MIKVKAAAILLPLILGTIMLIAYAIHTIFSAKTSSNDLAYNYGCRGNMLVEGIYNDKRVTMNATIYFSFLDANKILYSISGTATLYNEMDETIDKKTIQRNVYFNYKVESREQHTYTFTSKRIDIDGVDNIDKVLASLVMFNSLFVLGHRDTLVINKYTKNTILIANNQSPVVMCVYRYIF